MLASSAAGRAGRVDKRQLLWYKNGNKQKEVIMLNKLIVTTLCLVVVLSLALVGCAPAPPVEKPITWKMQVIYPPPPAGVELGASWVTNNIWAPEINEKSKGRLVIEVYAPGVLVKTKEALDALNKGMIDVLHSSVYYYPVVPEGTSCFWLPFGFESAEQLAEIYPKLKPILREAYAKYNVHYAHPVPVASMGLILGAKPVNRLEDVKGLKLRAAGGAAAVAKALGAEPVTIAPAEMYMALQRGTVDGHVYPFYAIETYKFYEVAKYVLASPVIWNPAETSVFINLDAFNRLPDDLKKIVEKASENTFRYTVDANSKWDERAFDICKKHGVEIITLPKEEVARFREACLPIWDEFAAKSPGSAQGIGIIKDYLKIK